MPNLRICPGRVILSLAAVACALSSPLTSRSDQPGSIHPCCKARLAGHGADGFEARSEWQDDYRAQLATGQREALEDTDLLHCDLDIEMFPDVYDNLAGTNTLTVQSKSAALTQFSFRLRSQFTIDEILVDGEPVGSPEILSGTTRVATLNHAYGLDEIFTIQITYRGHAVSRGFGSIEFDLHDGHDIVYTLSEPFYAYTWWPTKDGDIYQAGNNGDKFTLDVSVIAPAGMVSAANGTLENVEALSGGRERYDWSSAYPIATYLACFASTNYNTYTFDYTPLAGGNMPVYLYVYPEHDNDTNRGMGALSVDMLYTLRNDSASIPSLMRSTASTKSSSPEVWSTRPSAPRAISPRASPCTSWLTSGGATP